MAGAAAGDDWCLTRQGRLDCKWAGRQQLKHDLSSSFTFTQPLTIAGHYWRGRNIQVWPTTLDLETAFSLGESGFRAGKAWVQYWKGQSGRTRIRFITSNKTITMAFSAPERL